MQFKRVGNRIQLLAYEGYDKAKKRARVRMLGAFSAYSPRPDEKLISKLDPEQRAELDAWIEDLNQRQKQLQSEISAQRAEQTLAELAGHLNDARKSSAIVTDQAQAIYAQLDAISKVLRGAGFKREAKTKNTPTEEKISSPFGPAQALAVKDFLNL